jgi:hypothetical protein
MRYLYTEDNCPACVSKKSFYKTMGYLYTERPASRIKAPEDEIDREALIQASMQNMELPVEVILEES